MALAGSSGVSCTSVTPGGNGAPPGITGAAGVKTGSPMCPPVWPYLALPYWASPPPRQSGPLHGCGKSSAPSNITQPTLARQALRIIPKSIRRVFISARFLSLIFVIGKVDPPAFSCRTLTPLKSTRRRTISTLSTTVRARIAGRS